MLLSTNGSGPFLVIWQIYCMQVFNSIVAKFWKLRQNGNLWALYYGTYICNFGIHAQDACLNYVDVFTVVIPLLH
jgi:hypothetical protein